MCELFGGARRLGALPLPREVDDGDDQAVAVERLLDLDLERVLLGDELVHLLLELSHRVLGPRIPAEDLDSRHVRHHVIVSTGSGTKY